MRCVKCVATAMITRCQYAGRWKTMDTPFYFCNGEIRDIEVFCTLSPDLLVLQVKMFQHRGTASEGHHSKL